MSRKTGASKWHWHLVTNQQNMLYMLAAGMVMSPAGFQGKHYADPLHVYPGWIPLFRSDEKIPAAALNLAVSEREHLLPCIASFDLRKLSGPMWRLSAEGRMRKKLNLAILRRQKNDIAILVRAPLPLPPTLPLGIYFRLPEDRQAFERAAGDVSNVDLRPYQIEVEPSLFAAGTEVAWPAEQPQALLPEDGNDIAPAFGQALGGALAMLYHLANRGDLGLAAFRLATGAAGDKDDDLVRGDPILAELCNWIDGGECAARADTRARLFWGVIRSLVRARARASPATPVDVALAYLENALDRLPEPAFRPRLEKLIADMRACFGLAGVTITELLERHKGSLSRPLLLFCLREHCTALLEFSHPLLSEAEYLLAGILFGARDGWLQLPRELRDPVLSAFVARRMALAEQRKLAPGFNLPVAPRPFPLRERFAAPPGKWNSMQREVALSLARANDWHDCVQTRITLTKGDHPASFERDGLQLILPEVISKEEIVDEAGFLRRLGQWPPPSVESGMLNKLADGQDIGASESGSSCG